MCMIAHRPASSDARGSNIPNKVIDTAIGRHPDGFGIAWREAGALRHEKFGPAESTEFRDLLKKLDKDSTIEYTAHWRFATHGKPCRDLSHPFVYDDPIEGPVAVFHNGVIGIATGGSHESDTSVFVRDVLARLPSGWWNNPALEYLVGESIGWSRIIVMTAAETVSLQEKSGKWDGGIWYSSEHKPYAAPPVTKGWSKGYQKPTALLTSGDDDWKQSESALWRPTSAGSYTRVDEGEEADDWEDIYGSPIISGNTWSHGGHELQRMYDFDRKKDGEYPQSMMCDECYTMGDAYVIEGKTYIDIGHDFGNVFATQEGA